MTTIADIEVQRQAAGVNVNILCVAAGIGRTTYFDAKRLGTARASTIAQLEAALKKLSGRPQDMAQARTRLVFTAWRSVLALVAHRAGVDAHAIYAHDPKKRATLNPEWRQAATLRARATYLANTVLGVRQADLAAALGLTPQAISIACQSVEDERDDATVDGDLDWIARQLGAEG